MPGSEQERLKIVGPIISEWFQKNARPLPWRTSPRCGYPTLVSELMAQQTTLAVVVPKFNEFIKRFPDFHSLACATSEDVLTMWEGLGYYRRARFLHECAKTVVACHGGELPQDLKELQSLPGIGPYTAGAISSFVFGKRAPLVDGNVLRVMSRILAAHHRDAKKYQHWACEWVGSAESPAIHNESLMEFGALVCSPKPQCGICPIRKHCKAFELNRVEEFPPALKRPEQLVTRRVLAVVSDGRRVLVWKNPADRLCGGQWNGWLSEPLPHMRGSSVREEVERICGILENRGLRVSSVFDCGEIRHVVFNEKMRLSTMFIRVFTHSKLSASQPQWAEMTDLPRPQSTILKKSISLLRKYPQLTL